MARGFAGLAVLLVPVYLFFGLSYAFREFDMAEKGQQTLAAGGIVGAVLIVVGLALGTSRPSYGWAVTGIGVALPVAMWFIADAIW